MSLDNKNDLDIRCDAVQKVSTAIAKLCTEDVEKVVAFATALMNGQQKATVIDDTEALANKKNIVVLSDTSYEIELCLERLHIGLDDLLEYFNKSKEDLKNAETRKEIIWDFDLNRIRLDVVTDYIARIREKHKIIVDAISNIESQVQSV